MIVQQQPTGPCSCGCTAAHPSALGAITKLVAVAVLAGFVSEWVMNHVRN